MTGQPPAPASLAAALADRYRVEGELGAGGMATVYLAHDLKHDRKVAIKVLRPELAAVIGAERFLAEIRTTANLQHPHILPLHDSGQVAVEERNTTALFYVMPYIEGESLRQRIDREKQLPIPDAVRITIEVASALDYAHRRGVIHRDIKPENILLHDGQALVADFGIALAASKAGGARMTETGMSLGTPHYMSPEQAMGEREITARSDVYALGCVMYEMLVGEPPFTGPTAQSIVAKVMSEKPSPIRRIRKRIPAGVEDAVLTALEKLPADRFGTAADFAAALSAPASRPVAAHRDGKGWAHRLLPVGAGVLLGAVIMAALGLRSSRPATAGSVERRQVTYSGRAGAPAISADGRFVAYIETRCPEPPARGGCAHLQVLEVGSARPVEVITGAERLSSPRWTFDGLNLVVAGALEAGRSGLFIVPRLGGTPRRLADEPAAFDTHPAADSAVLATTGDTLATLAVVALASGQRVGAALRAPVIPLDVAWSPDGRTFAVSTFDRLHLVGRQDGTLHSLDRSGTRGPLRWSADGRHILSFQWTAGQDDDLIAFPLTERGELGRPHLVASQLPTLLRGRFDVARETGRVVIGSGSEFHDIWSFDVTAGVRARRLTQGTSWYGPPFLSADGRTLYYLRADPIGNSLYRVVDGRESALTAEHQWVNNSLRLTRDESTAVFESKIDTAHILMMHDIAAGTTRRVPRGSEDLGWLLPGGGSILWLGEGASPLSLSDANGANRRAISIQVPAGTAPEFAELIWYDEGTQYGTWFLAPDGESVAIFGGTRNVATLARVPLRGGTLTPLGSFPRQEGNVGLAGWSPDGNIYLARSRPGTGTTALLQLDAATGTVRSQVELPVPCHPRSVTYATAGRRAACVVRETRADVMLFEGIRP